jgi:hypothetical protein
LEWPQVGHVDRRCSRAMSHECSQEVLRDSQRSERFRSETRLSPGDRVNWERRPAQGAPQERVRLSAYLCPHRGRVQVGRCGSGRAHSLSGGHRSGCVVLGAHTRDSATASRDILRNLSTAISNIKCRASAVAIRTSRETSASSSAASATRVGSRRVQPESARCAGTAPCKFVRATPASYVAHRRFDGSPRCRLLWRTRIQSVDGV